MGIRLLAGETKETKKKDYIYIIYIYKTNLAFFETLLKKNKYNPKLIKPIIKYYSNEIKITINKMVELGKK